MTLQTPPAAERGSALLMTLLAVAVLSVLAVSLLQVAHNRVLGQERQGRLLVARYLAEAGLERAVAEVRRDVTWSPPLGVPQEVAPGRAYRYDAWQWDDGRGVFRLTSTGLVGDRPLVGITAEFKPRATPEALSYLVCAGDDIQVTALGTNFLLPLAIDLEGRVHAEDRITLQHLLGFFTGPPRVDTASTSDNDPADFVGFTPDHLEAPRRVARPAVNLDYYRQAAKDFGTYYSGNQTIWTVAARNNLVFVDGDATVYSFWRSSGLVLVAAGNVKLLNIDLSGKRNLSILAGGDITFTSLGGTLNGVLVAGGDIRGDNLSRFEGSMIARNVVIDGGLEGSFDGAVVQRVAPVLYFAGSGPLTVNDWVEKGGPPGP